MLSNCCHISTLVFSTYIADFVNCLFLFNFNFWFSKLEVCGSARWLLFRCYRSFNLCFWFRSCFFKCVDGHFKVNVVDHPSIHPVCFIPKSFWKTHLNYSTHFQSLTLLPDSSTFSSYVVFHWFLCKTSSSYVNSAWDSSSSYLMASPTHCSSF